MKIVLITILIIAALIGGGFFLSKKNAAPQPPAQNVTTQNGKQIIEIRARGGYKPRTSFAGASTPTTLRFITNGTFDCSSAIRIAKLHITKNLPSTGTTDIEIGAQQPGTLEGSCGMGMYPFTIIFQ